jgi:hypothetical protein
MNSFQNMLSGVQYALYCKQGGACGFIVSDSSVACLNSSKTVNCRSLFEFRVFSIDFRLDRRRFHGTVEVLEDDSAYTREWRSDTVCGECT